MPNHHSHKKSSDGHSALLLFLGAVVVLVAVVVVGASGVVPGFRLAIVSSGGRSSGFEGLQTGVQGITIDGQNFVNTQGASIDITSPTRIATDSYKWLSNSNNNAIIEYSERDTEGAILEVSISNPTNVSAPTGAPTGVSYYVQAPNGTYYEVTGRLDYYNVTVTLTTQDTNEEISAWAPATFHNGETLWFNLYTNTWNNAEQVQDYPTGAQYGTAWEGILSAVVTSSNIQNPGQNYDLVPSAYGESGDVFTLYTSPTSQNTALTLSTSNLNSTLASGGSGWTQWEPDTFMSNNVYFSVTLTNFGESIGALQYFTGGGTCPIATYNIQIVALQLGVFTLANPNGTTPPTNPGKSQGQSGIVGNWSIPNVFAGLESWLSNPFNDIILVIVILIVLIVVVTIFLTFTSVGRATDKAGGSFISSRGRKGGNHR